MSGRLEGRVAFITGASSGIGAACARRFVDEGATVAGFDLQDPADGHPLAGFWSLDVRDEAAITAAVAAAGRGRGCAHGPGQRRRRLGLGLGDRPRRGGVGPHRGHQPQGDLPGQQARGPPPRGRRQRGRGQPGQHRGPGGTARAGRLQRLQGRRGPADPQHGHRLRPVGGAGQLPLPRLHRDADDRGAVPARLRGRPGRVRRHAPPGSSRAGPRRSRPRPSSWPPTTPPS